MAFRRKSGIAARQNPYKNTRQRLAGVSHMETLRAGTLRRMERGEWSSLKAEIIEERGEYCERCGKPTGTLILDHKVPIAQGGANTKRNLWLLCYGCDEMKPGSANRRGAKLLHGTRR